MTIRGTARPHGPMKTVHAIASAADSSQSKAEEAEPDELFHYTDVNGLIGIVQNKGELWATDVRCMNDTGELKHGRALLKDALRSYSHHPAAHVLEDLFQHPACTSSVAFATALTELRDSLSQWRAYANDGRGFAIGFRASLLHELRHHGMHQQIGPRLRSVQYDTGLQVRDARNLVRHVLEALESSPFDTEDSFSRQLMGTVVGMVVTTFSAARKSQAFSEEKEHRLVLPFYQDPLLRSDTKTRRSAPTCSFRKGRYGITPYVKLRIPEEKGLLCDAITQVVLAPRCEPGTEEMVRILLANGGARYWSTLPVVHSEATYR